MEAASVKTKHLVLAEQLRAQILNGELRPGDRLPSLTQMHEQYGLSRPTVERAHTQLVQEGLIVREPGRGVFVAQIERGRTMTGVIGITGFMESGDLSPHNALFVSGVRLAATAAGWDVLLLSRNSTIHWEKVDGVLNQEACAEFILPRLPPGIPCVSTLTPFRGLNNVIADEEDGIRSAVEHLYQLGHRRIAYLITPPVSTDLVRLRNRLRSYHETMRQLGIEVEPGWVRPLDVSGHPELTYRQCAHRSMQRWLTGDWHSQGCTALLAQNDESAVGAIEALGEAGIAVPQDVSVVGFDGAGLGDYFRPSLTSVELPLREIGVRSVELLVQQMQQEGDRVPVTLTLPTQLKIGESTGPVA